MKIAYIFHDAFANATTDWYPWMKTTLETMGYVTIVPNFPTPAGQSMESWRAMMKNHLDKFDGETLFVGHGTGGVFAMRLVETLAQPINGLFVIASYAEPIGHAGYDRVNESFLKSAFDWNAIKNHARVIQVIAGENDPFVPAEISKRLADNLGQGLVVIPEGGHINKASGFTQSVAIAHAIKESIGKIDKSIDVESEVSADGTGEVNVLPPAVDASVRENLATLVPAGMVAKDALDDNTENATGDTSHSMSKSMDEGGPENALGGEMVVPIPPQSETVPKPVPEGVHTMYQDMSKLVHSNQGAVASELLGQARTQEAEKKIKSPVSPKNMLYSLGTLVIIAVVLGIGFYIVQPYLPAMLNNQVAEVPSLIPAETHQEITIGNKMSYEIEELIRTTLGQSQLDGTLRDIYYREGTGGVSFARLLEMLDRGDVPVALRDQFGGPMFMHGSWVINNKPARFLVIPIKNYDIAFSEMKSWEATMFRDIGLFFNVPDDFIKTRLMRDTFSDIMIANRNVRVLNYVEPIALSDEGFENGETISGQNIATIPNIFNEPVQDGGTISDQAGQTGQGTSGSLGENNQNQEGVANPETGMLAESSDQEEPVSNFISESIQTFTNNNPLVPKVIPYQQGDLMLAYFFLTERAVIIVDDVSIIPEIVKRWANRQVYE